MPITYEPASPLGGSIAEDYGQLQQQNKRSEFQLKVAEAQAQAHARDQANANQVSQMNAQVNMASEHNRLQSEAQTAQMQTGMNERQMSVDAQAAHQQREFNYADNLRLQNLQQQRSMIENQSDLSESERADLLRQMDPNISALKFRQQQTQMQQEKQQTQRMMHQNAQAATIQSLNADAQAQGALGRVVNLQDDQGNDLGPHQWDMQHGRYDPLPVTATRGGSGAGATASQGPRPMSEAQIATLRRGYERDVRSDPSFIGKPQGEIDVEVARRVALARQTASGEQLEPARPITATTPEQIAALPADQRSQIRLLPIVQNEILHAGSGMTEEQQQEARRDVSRGEQLFRQYGSTAAMPFAERREFHGILENLQAMRQEAEQRRRTRVAAPARGDRPISGMTLGEILDR